MPLRREILTILLLLNKQLPMILGQKNNQMIIVLKIVIDKGIYFIAIL